MCQSTLAAETCSLCPNKCKYKCPKCEIRSCSLQCVNKHKESTGCDGKRDRTKFKPLGAMEDMDVVNDFRLLEDVSKGLDKCKRDKLKRSTRQGTEVLRAPRLAKHLQRLQNQARARGVRLKLLPPHFVRRKENTSMFHYKERIINWKVQLVFPNCTTGNQLVTLSSVNEKTKVWRMLQNYIEGNVGETEDDIFQLYRGVSYGGISIYLKAEGLPGPGEKPRRFYPFDLKRSLKTNLKNTGIVEHPILYIVFKSEDCNYREDQDCYQDTENDEPSKDPSVNVGDVLSEADAMTADPEAYKQYFDFYLKYYSAKYTKQGLDATIPAVGPLRAPTVNPITHPAQLLLQQNNTYPSRNQQQQQFQATPRPQSFAHNYIPNFNRPPPTFSQRPPSFTPTQPPPSKYPSRSAAQNKFAVPPPSSVSALNVKNSISAEVIKTELKKTAGLGLLAAYGSDSDSD